MANVEGGLMEPLFSVVIPVYNRAGIVVRAINSVQLQSCQDFEIIVVDDGSTDHLRSVLNSIKDSRIRLVCQANRGASAARNHGIDVSRGRFVAFLDSDDAFLPHHLEVMELLLRDHEDVVGYSPVRAHRGNDYVIKPPRAIAPGEAMATYLMCGRGFVQTSGLVVPVAGARKVRYRIDVSYGDDTDFAIRLQLARYRFVMTGKPGVDWFDGPDPARLSNVPLSRDRLAWLEDLKPSIPPTAYHGYRGWHVAKGIFMTHPFTALGLYVVAVTSGAYGPSLALLVLAQIVVPSRIYRDSSNFVIRLITRHRQTVKGERSA
jgi:glycosyltransferase involved in cell wall biosynthesis